MLTIPLHNEFRLRQMAIDKPLRIALTHIKDKRDIMTVILLREERMPQNDDPDFTGTVFQLSMQGLKSLQQTDGADFGYHEPIAFDMTLRAVRDFMEVANTKEDILDLSPANLTRVNEHYGKLHSSLQLTQKREILCYR